MKCRRSLLLIAIGICAIVCVGLLLSASAIVTASSDNKKPHFAPRHCKLLPPILVINIGSTSVKAAIFFNERSRSWIHPTLNVTSRMTGNISAAAEIYKQVKEEAWRIARHELLLLNDRSAPRRDINASAIDELFAQHKVFFVTPMYFTNAHRGDTREALEAAGLNLYRWSQEAVAVALNWEREFAHAAVSHEQNLIVIDAGGDGFQIALLNVDDGFFEVLALRQVPNLSGRHFDDALAELVAKQAKMLEPSKTTVLDQKAIVEAAKRMLSTENEVSIEFLRDDNGGGGAQVGGVVRISRSQFEEEVLMHVNVEQQLTEAVDGALSDAMLNRSSVHRVILAGGSANIPLLQRIVREKIFGEQNHLPLMGSSISSFVKSLFASKEEREVEAKKPILYLPSSSSFDPQLLAVTGALRYAVQTEVKDARQRPCLLCEIIEYKLGIETAGGWFLPILNRYLVPPVHNKVVFKLFEPNQTTVQFRLVRNDASDVASEGEIFSEFELSWQMRRNGESDNVSAEVIFDIDEDMVLKVKAQLVQFVGVDNEADWYVVNSTTLEISPREYQRLLNATEFQAVRDQCELEERVGEEAERKNRLISVLPGPDRRDLFV